MKYRFTISFLTVWLVSATVQTVLAQNSTPVQLDEGCDLGVSDDRIRIAGGCDGIYRQGYWLINYSSGTKAEEGVYQKGRMAGMWRSWYKSGGLFSESTYADTGSVHPMLVKTYYDYKNMPKSETTFGPDGVWLVQTDWDTFGRKSSYPNARRLPPPTDQR